MLAEGGNDDDDSDDDDTGAIGCDDDDGRGKGRNVKETTSCCSWSAIVR